MPAESALHPPQRDQGRGDPNRNKKVIIVVLLLGLLVAVATQPGEQAVESESQPASLSLKITPVAQQGNSPQSSDSPSTSPSIADTRELSRFSLDDVMELPVFKAEPIKRNQVAAESLRVHAIYGSADEKSAIVGESIVRSGQPLPDGRRVLHVTPEGVKLGR